MHPFCQKEFQDIYNLEIEVVPTAKKMQRKDLSDFVYVFSPAIDDEDAIQGNWMSFDNDGAHQVDVGFDSDGALAFKENFGNNGISSPFQDGGYIYLVIPGSGSGTSAKAPALLVADIENPLQMHKTLTP